MTSHKGPTAINRTQGLLAFDDGEVVEIKGWHAADGGDVEPEAADFITFQFPGGGWGSMFLSEFEAAGKSH